MQDLAPTTSQSRRSVLATLSKGRARIAWIAIVALLGLLCLAWIDGGEEPIRPITQPIPTSLGEMDGDA